MKSITGLELHNHQQHYYSDVLERMRTRKKESKKERIGQTQKERKKE